MVECPRYIAKVRTYRGRRTKVLGVGYCTPGVRSKSEERRGERPRDAPDGNLKFSPASPASARV
eukprot:scaffold44738_cov28-Tisochrysis_lutea.AAC.1